jgi:diketogulonate reductase-like aldo/keto reductase
MSAPTTTIRLNNGTDMPALGLGVYQSPPHETVTAVEAALSERYRLIDTAAAYGNEEQVGQAVKHSGVPRDQVFITTKLFVSDYGYDTALRAFDTSAQRLGSDYVDLYLLHQPVPTSFDATVASYRALERLLADRKVRAIGVCNFSAQHLADLMEQTDVSPAVNQVEVHPFFTQAALRRRHADLGITTQAWSPIGGVTVYWHGGAAAGSPLEHRTIVEIATGHHKTPAQIILAWHLQHGNSAIPKSVHRERIAENAAIGDIAPSADEMASIDALDTGARGGPDPNSITLDYGTRR